MTMKFHRLLQAIAGTALLGGAIAANAEGLSVGGSLARSDWKGSDIGGVTTDTTSTGGKLYGGWSFTPNLGLEAGYVRFGKFTSAAGEAKADGAYIDAVGTWPIANGFSALGRVGVFNGKVRNTLLGDDRGTSWKLGAGLQYDFDRNWGVRGEWERYRFNALNEKNNADLWSIGVNYRF